MEYDKITKPWAKLTASKKKTKRRPKRKPNTGQCAPHYNGPDSIEFWEALAKVTPVSRPTLGLSSSSGATMDRCSDGHDDQSI